MELVAAVLFCAFSSSAYSQVMTPGSDFTGKASILSEIDRIDESIVLVRSPGDSHDVKGIGVYLRENAVGIYSQVIGYCEPFTLKFKVPDLEVRASRLKQIVYLEYYSIIEGQNFNDAEAVLAEEFSRETGKKYSYGTTVSWNKDGLVITKDRKLQYEKTHAIVTASDIEQKLGDFLFLGPKYFGVCTHSTSRLAIYRHKVPTIYDSDSDSDSDLP